MKELILIRHAKSNWGEEDIERPLTEEGRLTAQQKARELHQQAYAKPDLVITSPATRAQQTTAIFAQALELPDDKIQVNPALYETDVETLLNLIQHFPPEADTVIIVGHNPTLSLLAGFLSDREVNLKPCGIFILRFDMNAWSALTTTEVEVILS